MALKNKELQVLETALTALTDIPKLELVSKINSLGKDRDRQVAELLLLSRRPEEAVSVLLTAKRTFRALRTLMNLHRWEAALDLAIQQQSHVDTVLAYRSQWMETMNEAENNPKFIEMNTKIGFDWKQVETKVKAEKEKERSINLINN